MSKRPNPWKTLEVRDVYDNPWISVTEHRVIDPNGAPAIYGKISMKNQAIGIIPTDTAGNTWLVGQYRYTLDAWSWEIPMGGSPAGESPLETAKRELREETGLAATHWEQILRLHTSNCVTDEEGFVFLAQQLTEGEPCFDETEQLEIRKLPLSDALEMAVAGEITDALSVAGLLALARRAERG